MRVQGVKGETPLKRPKMGFWAVRFRSYFVQVFVKGFFPCHLPDSAEKRKGKSFRNKRRFELYRLSEKASCYPGTRDAGAKAVCIKLY